ncbi:hypothetical protein J6TS2_42400 [Heyndrickxia sporothermodurans]|nr:hypothetical protein J6TS2_42400 [Heyndrickxia sporothermodurans]
MNSKIAHVLNESFMYKEEVFPNDNGYYNLPKNATYKPLPEPNWKLKFDIELEEW